MYLRRRARQYPQGRHARLQDRRHAALRFCSGNCTSPCALAPRAKTSFADLTGLARIRWNSKMSGFHQIRAIVKLADGTWLIGDRADGSSTRDWIVSEFTPSDLAG